MCSRETGAMFSSVSLNILDNMSLAGHRKWYGMELISLFRSDRFLKLVCESIFLEGRKGLGEYVPAGRLKGKTALIIDGEYVLSFVADLIRILVNVE